jgi:hypothetical protein
MSQPRSLLTQYARLTSSRAGRDKAGDSPERGIMEKIHVVAMVGIAFDAPDGESDHQKAFEAALKQAVDGQGGMRLVEVNIAEFMSASLFDDQSLVGSITGF